MNEVLGGMHDYDGRLETLHGRNTLMHRTAYSFAEAFTDGVSSGLHHPLFLAPGRVSGAQWRYAFLGLDGTIHRAPGVRSPDEQRPIFKLMHPGGFKPIRATILIEDTSGDVLLLHQPDLRQPVSKERADYHVDAWREHVLRDLETKPDNAMLLYSERSGVAIANYRNEDVHIITALPARAGHTVQTATEGFPRDLPIIRTDHAPWRREESRVANGLGGEIARLALAPLDQEQ